MSTDAETPKRDKYGISTEKPTQERWNDMKVRDQIGITVDVERSKEGGEVMSRANRAINDVGDFIHAEVPQLKGLDYLGSAAVHIYMAPTLNQLVFVSQTQPLLETPERIAGPAFTDLQKSMMAAYGRKQTKVRSGF